MNGINSQKSKKLKFLFPLTYLREILNEVRNILYPPIITDWKSFSLNAFSRLFGTNRSLVVNVLVLVSDLENNAGAACIELLSNDNPEFFKRWGFRHPENNYESYNNENYFDFNDFNIPELNDECRILDANLDNIESGNDDINPNYLMQLSLSSTNSLNRSYDENSDIVNNNYIKSDDYNSSVASCSDNPVRLVRYAPVASTLPHQLMIQQPQMRPYDTESSEQEFTSTSDQIDTWTQSTSSYEDYEENLIDENEHKDDSDDDDDYYSTDDENLGAHSIPKPILREMKQLKSSGVPYDYEQITESSHEQFKHLKSNSKLTKHQINLMVNTRRRFINRRAATRCRNQKLHVKDNLKDELKKLQHQLLQTQITLNKTYQKRNESRDEYRRVQNSFVPRLVDNSTNQSLVPRRWNVELKPDRSGLIIREHKSTTSFTNQHQSSSS